MFCEIVAGREPCEKVAEDERTFAFMDIDPGADGHVLVIPKAHSADLLTIPPDDLIATTLMAQRIAQAAPPALGADGITMLNCCGEAGWQTVHHFHLHVIPRYADRRRDRMELPYAPGRTSDPAVRADFAAALASELPSTHEGASDHDADFVATWVSSTQSLQGDIPISRGFGLSADRRVGRIRDLVRADLAATPSWLRERSMLPDRWRDEHTRTLIAEDGAGEAIGAGAMWTSRVHSDRYSVDLIVAPAHRRAGIATALLAALADLQPAPKPLIWGAAETDPAHGFAATVGARTIQRAPLDTFQTSRAARLSQDDRVTSAGAIPPAVVRRAWADMYEWTHADWHPVGPDARGT